jgi:ectoine hydroxylase
MQPERVLEHAPKVLSQAQREFYFQNGYLLLDGFVGEAWMQRLWDATDRAIEESRRWQTSDAKFDLEPGHSAGTPRLRRLTQPVMHDPVFWEFTSAGPITDVAEDLLGPNVVFHHSKLNFKWSGGGAEVKWHQDIPFYPHTNYSVLAIGLYMNGVDDEMGPMGAIPGSHRGPIYDHYNARDEWTGALNDDDADRLPLDTVDWLKGRAGTITVHHCRTVHGSLPNNSTRMRPLLVNAFSAADARPCTFNPVPSPYNGTVVRGQQARWIEFDQEPCLNPPDWSGGYSSIFALQQQEQAGRKSPGLAM